MNSKTAGMQDPADTTMHALRALSVKQPWASMIAGLCPGVEKTIETRTWATDYRGPLLIVSSLKPDQPTLHWPRGEYPAGKALCIANLIACRAMTWRDAAAARCDLYYKAMAWVLTDIKQIEPFPVRGRIGLYTVTPPRGIKMLNPEHEGHEDK